jgi:hypothetical protein
MTEVTLEKPALYLGTMTPPAPQASALWWVRHFRHSVTSVTTAMRLMNTFSYARKSHRHS